MCACSFGLHIQLINHRLFIISNACSCSACVTGTGEPCFGAGCQALTTWICHLSVPWTTSLSLRGWTGRRLQPHGASTHSLTTRATQRRRATLCSSCARLSHILSRVCPLVRQKSRSQASWTISSYVKLFPRTVTFDVCTWWILCRFGVDSGMTRRMTPLQPIS